MQRVAEFVIDPGWVHGLCCVDMGRSFVVPARNDKAKKVFAAGPACSKDFTP